jgi:type IX secretion system PorP/SprF family membrane protein
MKRILHILSLTLMMVVTGRAVAQDPHYSQYFSSPLTLNPAFTGYYDGKHRLTTNFRNQWLGAGDPFTTATIGFDTRVMSSKFQNNLLGIGINVLGDRTATGAYNSNYASLSAAYHQSLDEEGFQHIGIGFQGNMGTRKLDYNRLPFNAQFASRGFDLSLDNTENFVSRNASYYDLNFGLLYNYVKDRKRFYFGTSYYHINQPSMTFLGNDPYTLPARLSIHSGASFLVGQQGELFLSGHYMSQGGANSSTIGMAYGYSPFEMDDNRVFYAGVFYRNKDAVYPYLGLLYNDFQIGLSYDVNTTGVQISNKRNRSFELSIVYHFFDPAALRRVMPWY